MLLHRSHLYVVVPPAFFAFIHVAIKQLGESRQPFVTPFRAAVSMSLPPPFLFTISSSPPSPSSLCTSRDANQPDCMPLYLSLPFSLSISAVHLGTKSPNQTNQSAVQHSARVPATPYRRPHCHAGITLIAPQPLPALLSAFATVSGPTPGITIMKQPQTLDGEGVGRCRQ